MDSEAALDPDLTGAKASSLARALHAGLPVLPGRVVTTAAFVPSADDDTTMPVDAELRAAWSAMSEGGRHPLVVRSSSTVEDGRTSSMAGLFTSVLDVHDWPSFRKAVDTVLESAKVVALADAGARDRAQAPMAVLIQPQLAPTVGGVMFGVDPVSGRADHLVISASEAGPSAVVSGEVDGSRYVLSRHRIVEAPVAGPLLSSQLRQLAALARQAARVFGGPQDVEWAFGADGRLWLLQSRPVTAVATAAPATGPVLGPGPVAETFPEPLSPLEQDLWVEPLRAGLRSALALGGTAPKRRLAASSVVTTVGGRVAADLDLLGDGDQPASVWSRLDPRPPIRRLVAAWRVGRLRAALPALASDLVATVDDDLLAVDAIGSLSDRELLGLLERSGRGLTSLHGHEVLMGWMVAHDASVTAAASVALRALAAGRAEGLTDEEIVVRHPSVLALVPPHVGGTLALPPTPPAMPAGAGEETPDGAAVLREALRLRARWVQELTARAAWELGERLARAGLLADAEAVRHLRLTELTEAVRTGALPEDVAERADARPAAPLPARFRLAVDGTVAPAAPARARGRGKGRTATAGGGTGAGGGRGMGPVHGGTGPPDPGAVLVVRTLDPDLAPLLPRLGGLVAETGSFLSHLAILAREFGVPTVVGVEGALSRFAAGSLVMVDGTTGEVELVETTRGAA
ncbi:MAG TPA: PEP/pyruvate-binding domain-containing protein [Acidimicrobiales bacterium]|nr:PEP/pyruvate-binding domain-containing protein [Acidimicrobiales bacterium]